MQLKPSDLGAHTKYDMLSALMLIGANDTELERVISRFVLVFVSRFNWHDWSLRMGQAEYARINSVSLRTAKRDFAVLRELGLVTVAVNSGRASVATYRVSLNTVMRLSEKFWDNVGTDFSLRMSRLWRSVSMHAKPSAPVRITSEPTDKYLLFWSQYDPIFFKNWLDGCRCEQDEKGNIVLVTQSPFVRNFLEQNSSDVLKTAAYHVFGKEVDVCVK